MASSIVDHPLKAAVNFIAMQLRLQRKHQRKKKNTPDAEIQKTQKIATSAAVVNNDKTFKNDIEDLNKMLAASQQEIAEMLSKMDSFEIWIDMMQDNFEMTFARLDAIDSIEGNLRRVVDDAMENLRDDLLNDLDESQNFLEVKVTKLEDNCKNVGFELDEIVSTMNFLMKDAVVNREPKHKKNKAG